MFSTTSTRRLQRFKFGKINGKHPEIIIFGDNEGHVRGLLNANEALHHRYDEIKRVDFAPLRSWKGRQKGTETGCTTYTEMLTEILRWQKNGPYHRYNFFQILLTLKI